MKGLQIMHLFISYHLIWALTKNMGKKKVFSPQEM